VNTQIDFWNALILFAVLQGFGLSISLFIRKHGNKKGNRILSFLVFIITIDALSTFAGESLFFPSLSRYLDLSDLFHVLNGPLLLLYTFTLTRESFRFSRKYLLMFIPFALELILFIPLYLQQGPPAPERTIASTGYRIVWAIELGVNFIYLFFSVRELMKHAVNIKREFSNVSHRSLLWLKRILIIATALYLMELMIILSISMDNPYAELLILMFYVLIALLFLSIGYGGLSQQEIYTGAGALPIPEKREDAGEEKYRKSSLSPEAAQEGLAALSRLMEKEKPHLNNDLKLTTLASLAGLSTNHLSQIINQGTGKSFYTYINEYRIGEAKELLADREGKNLTMIALAEEAGFSSKSSFNKVFKDMTGMTPSDYKKSPAGT